MINTSNMLLLELLREQAEMSSREIFESFPENLSYATIKRMLTQLVETQLIETTGQGKATRYRLSLAYKLIHPVDMETYFDEEIDDRAIQNRFNLQLIPEVLHNCTLFTSVELAKLNSLQKKFVDNVSQLSKLEYQKEMERLAIDLSWKSSQIEGNTYSLLETERLLKDKETAAGKTKEEAVMLLNHKEVIDFVVGQPDYLVPLAVSKIEDIHKVLVKELGVDTNLRRRRVGISGTNYKPLENEFQIIEALAAMCNLVNEKVNVFEKALLILLLISYIQPFADGNKRTARIISNAVLINYGYCPISFRTVDAVDYKKAMLIFYEQNNIYCFKQLFIEQFEFAVDTYF